MKITLVSLSDARIEYAAYVDGQLVGYISKLAQRCWFVRGLGECPCPVTVETKAIAIKALLEAV